MRFKIKDLLNFIRTNDRHKVFSHLSGNQLRAYVYACLKKDSLYIIYDTTSILGFFEWYRVKDWKHFVTAIAQAKYSVGYKQGVFLWIQAYVFKKGYLTPSRFKRFLKFHKGIKNYFWYSKHQHKYMLKVFKLKGA